MSMCHTKKWKLLLWSWYAFKPCFSWEHTLNANTSHASNAFLLYIYNFRYHHTSGDKQSKFFIRRSLCAHFVVFLFHIFKAALAFAPCPFAIPFICPLSFICWWQILLKNLSIYSANSWMIQNSPLFHLLISLWLEIFIFVHFSRSVTTFS